MLITTKSETKAPLQTSENLDPFACVKFPAQHVDIPDGGAQIPDEVRCRFLV
jgi:hypothetical protein